MTIRKCKECGNKVSSNATACPSCGAPMKRKSSPLAVGCVVLMVIIAVVAITARRGASPSPPSAPNAFDVEIVRIPGGGLFVQVGFQAPLASPTAVDRIIRESLEQAVRANPTESILAMGFLGNDPLSSNQYSGELVYEPTTKKIVTMDEHRGVRTTEASTADYFVEIREDRTLRGITPERTWLTVTIVFPKQPPRDAAYEAIFSEITKLAARGLDINAYVSVGDSKIATSWKQMRDGDGAYVFAEYEAKSQKITRQGQVLREYP